MNRTHRSGARRTIWALGSLLLLGAATPLPNAMAQHNAKTELPTAKPEKVGVSSERLKRVPEMVQRFIDGNRISGAVTIIARKGRIVLFEPQGVMDIETKKPMRRDTLFAMASTTKPVIGVAIMMLMEEGKLQINDPVSKYLPAFKGQQVATQKAGSSEVELVPANREITLRDLLTHTSGLGTGGAGSAQSAERLRLQENDTLETFVNRVATMPLDFQPGTLWRYSGLVGIDVLSRIIEVVSGQSLDVFLKQRIFEPLGMKNTFFFVPESEKDRLATIYQSDGKSLTKSQFRLNFPAGYFSGSGGLYSTAEDFYRFAQMLLNQGELNGKRLLSPRGVELYSANHVGEMMPGQLGRPKGMGFGLTVEVMENSAQAGIFRSNGSFGWDGAFGTYICVDPKEQMVTVLMIQLPGGQIMHRPFETAALQAIVE